MAKKQESKGTTLKVITEQTAIEYGLQLFEKLFQSVDDQQGAPAVNPEALAEILSGAIEKRDELAEFILRWEREVETIKEIEIKPATNKARSISSFCNGLREALAMQMESWHDKDGQPAILKRVNGHIHMILLKESAEKLVIDDEAAVPDEFVTYTRTVDRAAVTAALRAGREVSGARLINGTYYVDVR